MNNVSGECTANIRKGKTIFFYELELKASWEGRVKGDETTTKGQFTAPYISEENDDDKMEVKVSCDTEGVVAEKVLSLVRSRGTSVVQKKIAEFLTALRAEFSVKATPQPAPTQASLPPFQSAAQTAPSNPSIAPKATSSSSKSVATKTIKLRDEFRGPAMEVYQSMVDPQRLNAIMQGSATMDPTERGKFSFFNGTITGENVTLVPASKIVQKWRFSSWPEGHYSTVRIDLAEEDGVTVLNLTQENVPSGEADKTEEGWRQNIWGRAKMMFGFGPMLF